MRSAVLLGWIVVLLLPGFIAQAQPQYAFRITFTNKDGAPDTSIPLILLSQRALDRRMAQGIALDETDRPVSPDYIDSVFSLTTGGKLHLTSRWLNHIVLLLTDSSQMLNLQSKPFIKSTQYIGYYSTALHKGIADDEEQKKRFKRNAKTTGTAAYYGQTYDQTSFVNGDYLHDLGFKGSGKLIAVFDEGFLNLDNASGFDSMRQAGRLKDRYNFPSASTTIIPASHGTKALSIMAGNLPGSYVGCAPHAEYAVYCTEIIGTEQYLEMDNLLAAAERSDSIGVDIISCSLGYNDFSGPASPHLTYGQINGDSTIAAKAANMARRKGMLFVASAGNDGALTWKYILTPGDADSAFTVGVTDNMSYNVNSNSGYGPNSSGKIKPDVCMPGPTEFLSDGNSPAHETATSWAVPQLAGWAACLWEAVGPAITPAQLYDAIIKSANMYNNPDNHAGYGVPNFKVAYELLGVKKTEPKYPGWVSLQPNPVGDVLSMNIYSDKQAQSYIRIIDISGKMVVNTVQKLDSGNQLISIPVSHLPSGIYLLKVATDEKEAAIRMQKK